MFSRAFRLLFPLFALLLSSSQAPAQIRGSGSAQPVNTSVHGQVRYAATRQPADQVLVRLEGFGSGIVGEMRTDRMGKFQFSGMPRAEYILTVHAPGYKDYQQTIELLTVMNEYITVMLTEEIDAKHKSEAPPARVDASVPAGARAEYERAMLLLSDAPKQKGRYAEAARHLEAAVSIYPPFLEAELMLGISYMDLGQWEKAEAALRRAMELNPKATTAAFALGDLYRHQKKYAEAEKTLTQALAIDEKSAQGHYTLGRVYFEKNDLAKAGPQVGRALQLKPDFADAHLLAGNILLRARQPENALAEFEEYLRLAPKGESAEQARQISQKIKDALASRKQQSSQR